MDQEYTAAYLEDLARKWKDGTLSEAEQKAFDDWYSSHNDELLELPEGYRANPLVLRREMEDELFERIRQAKAEQVTRTSGLWRWVTIAAAMILIVSVIIYLMIVSPVRNDMKLADSGKSIEVAPGGSKATLILSDGRKVALTNAVNGVIATEPDTRILKHKSGALVYQATDKVAASNVMNTIVTPRGGEFRLVLPDGTKVWVNAATTVRYPTRFQGRTREVELSGEAYFEVSHNPRQPFIVKTGKQLVEVLGTHFNINSYDGDNYPVTTLAEGRVRLSLSGNANNGKVILKPGQQARREGDHFKVEAANLDMVLAWTNGRLKFQDATITQIMNDVSRWYDVDIRYDGAIPQERFIGGISRKADLSSLLKIFEASQIKFSLEQRGGKKTLVIKP